MRNMHEEPDWAAFQWGIVKLAKKLATVHYKQGLLLGRMNAFGFSIRTDVAWRL
jgi:hypothetical protein